MNNKVNITEDDKILKKYYSRYGGFWVYPDLLNTALFGMTAKQWREANPDKKGNIRDYATLNQLLVLANAESYNSVLINEEKSQGERLVMLRNAIVNQLKAIEQINIENLPILE